MENDSWGHELTTDEPQAAIAFEQAVEGYVAWRTDVMDHIKAANEADPDFALPYAVKGILMWGLRKPELRAPAQKMLDAARAARTPESERELFYISALEAAIDGRVTECVSHVEAIARAHPHDLLALRLAQFELFWIGEAAWMRDISERAAPAWSKGDKGLGAYLAIRAFGLEEAGDYAQAERCGREAVEIDPADPWGAHAVAHVLIMQGRLEEGIGWCSELSQNWGAANHIRHHNWWHLALFHTEAGNYGDALGIYDQRLRDMTSPLMEAVPDFFVDIQNDVALLQRLELRGVDVGGRWSDIGELCAERIGNHTSPFTSAHSALGLAAAGRFGEADELISAMNDFIATDRGSLGPRYALAALPAAQAALAHRRGEHQKVLDILVPARRNLWQMGGSHAQRDLFFQLLADSAHRLGRADILSVLFEEMGAIGLEHLEERSSYADALASLQ
ncbi:MAG: tetratricopeptide repeat protein [Rhizobiales bacterium]|nr:tetratricopeptide repeat protein [Hyphomicrobiales bacterium]